MGCLMGEFPGGSKVPNGLFRSQSQLMFWRRRGYCGDLAKPAALGRRTSRSRLVRWVRIFPGGIVLLRLSALLNHARAG